MLKPAEFDNLGGEIEGSDGIFLGSCFLSHRTDIGVNPAALRASIAYSTSQTASGVLKELMAKFQPPLKAKARS